MPVTELNTTTASPRCEEDGVEACESLGWERAATEPLPVVFVIMQTGNNANGGVESITQVLEHLQRVKPIVVTQVETPINRRWREAGFEVHVWPLAGNRVHSVMRFNYRIYRLLRLNGYEIVHCNDILALWLAGFGAKSAGASVVFNIRNVKPPGQKYRWHWRIARRLSDRQLVLSREMRDSIARRLNIPKDNGRERSLEFIYSIVDPARLSPIPDSEREKLRRRLGIGPSCFAVGMVGAFDVRKGQLELIREAGLGLKQAVPQAKVYFVGDFEPTKNNYARLCQGAVEESRLRENVSFVGYTPDVADWYRALDAVVITSRNEGMARSMIESLACGTPVISFDVCSAREILEEGDCGMVVSQGDFGKLVERLTVLAQHDSIRQEMGARGARAARELFDPQFVVRQYEDLYLSVVGV